MSSLTESEAAERLSPLAADAGPVIRVEGVSVRYRLPHERIPSIKDYAIRRVKGQVRFDDFWALRDIDFVVREGETVGIVGHNGAGKSTLLKLVAGVLRPTHGRVWVKGRVAPLLQLGAVFDTEMTGRENVFLNATLLGFRAAEVARRLDHIVDFAGVREFIDMPLRTYSTGMVARLGFAIATDVQPDVLIVDEVLSVGDEEFQRKSKARLRELRAKGDAILLVSHDLESIRKQCHRALWLDHGRLVMAGPPGEVVDAYRRASAQLP
jgi:ABC-2 type transport system ATP-binding protein/lipopolysaccharide transport system ATP-binding protein